MSAGRRWPVIAALGVTQIFAWGSSYYLPAVLAKPISLDTGWSLAWVVGGLSLGLLIAGFASPWVGRAIARMGGRPILAVSAVLLATGQLMLAAAPVLPVYLVAWIVLGIGMGAGLYDPAFAALGRLYGHAARSSITTVTLFGGFASTVCWPLSAFLEAHFGWRTTCLVYAVLQLGIALPIYLFALPREPRLGPPAPEMAAEATAVPALAEPARAVFLLLATVITLSSVISTALSVHLLTILQARGIGLAAAVSFGALVGPSQVAARFVEMLIARYHHPIWTKLASTSLVMAGMAAFLTAGTAGPVLLVALVLYGAGIGLESIARGTVPLAVYGPERYPAIMGRIAMPSLIAQAATPSAAAVLLQWGGANGALWSFLAVAICNVLFAGCLFLSLRSRRGLVAI